MQAALVSRRVTFRKVFLPTTSSLSLKATPCLVADSADPIRIAAAPTALVA